MVKHPEAVANLGDLRGPDGNAYAIMARAERAMRKAGVAESEIDAYLADAMSDDYAHLLRVTQETVTCAISTPMIVSDLAATLRNGSED